MQKTLLAIAVAVLPASAALAEQPGSKPDQFTSSGKLLPVKGASTGNSCAAYGPGFIKVEGTGTCVKIGGAVRIDAGSSVGSH